MYQKDDFVVYKRDVCQVQEIRYNKSVKKDYYMLKPMGKNTLTIGVPVDSVSIRAVISKQEVLDIISKIPEIELIEAKDNRFIENEYKVLINSDNHDDLIRIIKTTFARNLKRKNDGKKIGERDDAFFQMAETLLYNEFSIALHLDYEATKQYVEAEVMKLMQH